jgi:hypothetical protein
LHTSGDLTDMVRHAILEPIELYPPMIFMKILSEKWFVVFKFHAIKTDIYVNQNITPQNFIQMQKLKLYHFCDI